MFTSTPILRDLERLMQQIPNFAPRGYGVMVLCEHDYSVKDCDCAHCSFHTGRGKKIRCMLERCVCIKERIQAGAATQREVLTETLSTISYPPFQRRLKQHLKESEERPMEFQDTKHRLIFAEAIQKRDIKNYALMSALYLLTADLKLWNVARRCHARLQ